MQRPSIGFGLVLRMWYFWLIHSCLCCEEWRHVCHNCPPNSVRTNKRPCIGTDSLDNVSIITTVCMGLLIPFLPLKPLCVLPIWIHNNKKPVCVGLWPRYWKELILRSITKNSLDLEQFTGGLPSSVFLKKLDQIPQTLPLFSSSLPPYFWHHIPPPQIKGHTTANQLKLSIHLPHLPKKQDIWRWIFQKSYFQSERGAPFFFTCSTPNTLLFSFIILLVSVATCIVVI